LTSRIEHVALWTDDLERSRAWYERWLGGRAGELYVNETRGFSSYFVEFDGGARLELMRMPGQDLGLRAHVAFALGSRERVDSLTEELRAAGVAVLDEPRTTGDGYYESVVADPDGNRVELTV
jgi:lactoylglutathione lyase